MRHLNVLIFGFIIFVIKINCQTKVVNTCSSLGYNEPANSDECKEDGEICCFVEIEDDKGNPLKFCVSSPSDIEMDDVKDEIKEYTGFTLKNLKCNKSQFTIYNSFKILALLIFMLF